MPLDMKQFMDQCHIKRQLDLANLGEDLGLLSEMVRYQTANRLQ